MSIKKQLILDWIAKSSLEYLNSPEFDEKLRRIISEELQKKTNNSLAIVNEVSDQAASKVLVEMNQSLLPRINAAMSWIGSQIQDGSEMVDMYIKDVNSDVLTICNEPSNDNKNNISRYVKTLY